MTVWTRNRIQLGIPLLGREVDVQDEVITHTEAGADLPADATVDQEVRRIQAIDAYHRSLGWGGFGYNAMACASGRAYEGRGGGRSGAHTVGRNDRPAIVFPGNGDRTPMTVAQVECHRRIQGQWISDGHLKSMPLVTGHRDYARKSCPGSLVYPELWRLRGVTGPPEPEPELPIPEDAVKDAHIVRSPSSPHWWLVWGGGKFHLHNRSEAASARALGASSRDGEPIPVDGGLLDSLPTLSVKADCTICVQRING